MPARATSIPPNYILILWLLMYFGARLLLKQAGLGTGLRIGIALAPVPVFAAFLWQAIRSIRSADEFERRVLLMTLALLQRAVVLKVEDWSYAHVWIYLPIFYLAGLALARKRYS